MNVRRDQVAWSDEEMLKALYLRDHELASGPRIAQRMGRSRGALMGMFNRVHDESMKHFPPDPHDGTMSPRWWAKRAGKPT